VRRAREGGEVARGVARRVDQVERSVAEEVVGAESADVQVSGRAGLEVDLAEGSVAKLYEG